MQVEDGLYIWVRPLIKHKLLPYIAGYFWGTIIIYFHGIISRLEVQMTTPYSKGFNTSFSRHYLFEVWAI